MSGLFRRVIASALAWIVGAMAAVGVGILALSLIGDGLTSRTVQPLTPDAVAREAAASSQQSSAPAQPAEDSGMGAAPESAPSTAPAAKATPAGTDKLVSSPGGTAVARCSGGQVYLVSWSPGQGFRADHVSRGPALQASLKFESDGDAKVFLTVRCVGGEPQATVSQRRDDGGGHG